MGNFTLTPELKEKIIAKAIDKGSAFLTGSPTTVFTTVSNVAETTGQVMGSAAAVPFKAMNRRNGCIANTRGYTWKVTEKSSRKSKISSTNTYGAFSRFRKEFRRRS